MENRTGDRKGANGRTNRAHHTAGRRTHVTQKTIGVLASPDFALVREVQMRATGANIHSLSQQLQIYVSALECGAMLQAQAAEATLRGWLAAGR
jgi:hypothetical protein